ncbi:MAG: tetratricopeptide repeat protein [Pyrinomonadaceae bacterium]
MIKQTRPLTVSSVFTSKAAIRTLVALCCLLAVTELEKSAPAVYANRAAASLSNASSLAQGDKDARALETERVVERELAGGEAHTYQIHLKAGQYLSVVVEQENIDAVVALTAPGGKQIIEMNSPNGTEGPEVASLIAGMEGRYHVEVRSNNKDAVAGRYRLSVGELRAELPQDRDRIAAQVSFVQGRKLADEGSAESLREGIKRLEESLKLRRALNDPLREAYTLTAIGSAYDYLGEYNKSLEAYAAVLPIARALKNPALEADADSNIGSEYYSLSEHQKALEYLEKSLQFYDQAARNGRTTVNLEGKASALNNAGLVYDALGETRKSLEYFNLALPLLQAIGHRRGHAVLLNNIGLGYSVLGENRKALDHYNQSLRISREVADRQVESVTLSNIGAIYDYAGEHEKALDHYNLALEISRSLNFRRGEAITLNNIGKIYNALDDPEKALKYLTEALPLWQALGERAGEARTINNIGHSYASMEDFQKALDYYSRALQMMQSVSDRPGAAQALSNIGSTYDSLGDRKKALDHLNQSLALRKEIGDRRGQSQALNHLGWTLTLLDEDQKAVESYEQALALSREVKDRALEAAAQRGLARLESKRGSHAQARQRMEEALSIVESLRAQLVSESLRSSYFASVQQYYEFEIDLLMKMRKQQPAQGFDKLALQTSERARARGLLELLSEAKVDIRQGVDPSLIERERSLQQRLNDKAERQTQLLNRQHTQAQADALAVEIELLLTQYQEVESQIRRNSPRYAALTQPQPISVKEIQENVLDSDSLLLEFALGAERSYLWVVAPDAINSFELPKRADVESAARRVYGLLTARNRQVKFETVDERNTRIARADAEYIEAASALSQMILGPAAAHLGRRRLLIISDGALDYIPFAALPAPHATSQKPQTLAAWSPLVLDHEIVNLPSASTLAALRRDLGWRKPAPKTLAVLADPVFEKDDERVRLSREGKSTDAGKAVAATTQAAQRSVMEEVIRSANETGNEETSQSIVRLPFTRREAEEILSLVPLSERKQALDFEANRAMATSAELAQYRFVHFATHGFLNSVHPELSGIVLSLVDERGAEQSGFLRANEIFNLKLPADLVALSGCRTGLGKAIRGEGLLGLTRGFMYAGASRVLVSLWGVSDEASAELMAQFYRKMLGRERLRPAAALRAAQLNIWKDKRWQSPYYWSAFILQGEPR